MHVSLVFFFFRQRKLEKRIATPSQADGTRYFETYSVFSLRIVRQIKRLIIFLFFYFFMVYAVLFVDLEPILNEAFRNCIIAELPMEPGFFALCVSVYAATIIKMLISMPIDLN